LAAMQDESVVEEVACRKESTARKFGEKPRGRAKMK